jgi:hypothetical protein
VVCRVIMRSGDVVCRVIMRNGEEGSVRWLLFREGPQCYVMEVRSP